ncbi:GAF domain-containing protein [Mucilaginibacter ginkgonis]|uniref:GAF domain-containing protein n=1 Tax=Mucilaginibacter ginkgonis TaxID=2682091 RepID=A0A6I4IMS3_9SPHI|nr:GAF domain-containing protein [Mucilaginibacter ginkgonis]QQL50174.1 GAF domain-containing protein [Mucilaginibacter ginkgonis]
MRRDNYFKKRFGGETDYRDYLNCIDKITKSELNGLLCVIGKICDTPVSLITLLSDRKQWFLCANGTDMSGNDADASFCQYLKPEDELLEVQDATLDGRFNNLDVVTGEFHIRFYAGIPLVNNRGKVIGSVCLFDTRIKTLSDYQKTTFVTLSKQIFKILEYKRVEEYNKVVTAELQLQKEKTESVLQKLRAYFDSSPSMHILLDLEMNVLDFNKESVAIIQKYLGKQILYEKNIINYITPGYVRHFKKLFDAALRGKRIVREVLIDYVDIATWWRITLRPVLNDDKRVVAVSYSAMNIHETKQHVEEISRQNNKLQEIAIIQSHGYRKPVASILGLIDIIRRDGNSVDEEILGMLEKAAIDLDEQIRKVVKFTEHN